MSPVPALIPALIPSPIPSTVRDTNVAPNAPALVSPANNVTLDRTAQQRFAWTFSDNNPGDTQSKADLRFSSDSGTTWTTFTALGPNGYYDLPASSLPSGSYQWQVRTYDSQVAVGPWSPSGFVSFAAPANAPIVSYPASGGVVNQNDRIDWSFSAAQQAYQVQRCADAAGSIDTNTVYFDTGQVTSATVRTRALTFETNNRYEWLRVRVLSGGLWTSWTALRVQVSYTPPPAPQLTLTPRLDATAGPVIDVGINTPNPSGGQPAATSVVLYVSRDGGATSQRRAVDLPPNTVWRFTTPASRVEYAFKVDAAAANGTSSTSGWVS